MKNRCVVGLEQLRLSCIIGIHSWERLTAQDIIIDLRVEFDASQCILSDSVDTAIDYRKLAQDAEDIACIGQYHLVETLAAKILDSLMAKYPISWAWVKIKKPQALQEKGIAFVEMEKRRSL